MGIRNIHLLIEPDALNQAPKFNPTKRRMITGDCNHKEGLKSQRRFASISRINGGSSEVPQTACPNRSYPVV